MGHHHLFAAPTRRRAQSSVFFALLLEQLKRAMLANLLVLPYLVHGAHEVAARSTGIAGIFRGVPGDLTCVEVAGGRPLPCGGRRGENAL